MQTAQSDLRVSKKENVVLIPDNEPRNKEIVKQIGRFINDGYSVVLWMPEYVKEKDINEMVMSGRTDTEIKTIINENVYSGIKAKHNSYFGKR